MLFLLAIACSSKEPADDSAVSVELSDVVPTVADLEWAPDRDDLDEAWVEFGLDTDYGMTAPLDLSVGEPYAAVLLGMKPSTTYHLRVVGSAGDEAIEGDDFTLETGAKSDPHRRRRPPPSAIVGEGGS